MTTRICTKCGLEKEISEYSWSIHGVKRHSSCKSCRVEKRMDYYQRNKEKEMEYKWDRQVRRREELRKFVFSYLSEHRCHDCGEYDPLVLTFDHVRGTKRGNVSQMVNQGYALEVIKEEISKCEVVCSNCHMRREKKRRGTRYW